MLGRPVSRQGRRAPALIRPIQLIEAEDNRHRGQGALAPARGPAGGLEGGCDDFCDFAILIGRRRAHIDYPEQGIGFRERGGRGLHHNLTEFM